MTNFVVCCRGISSELSQTLRLCSTPLCWMTSELIVDMRTRRSGLRNSRTRWFRIYRHLGEADEEHPRPHAFGTPVDTTTNTCYFAWLAAGIELHTVRTSLVETLQGAFILNAIARCKNHQDVVRFLSFQHWRYRFASNLKPQKLSGLPHQL